MLTVASMAAGQGGYYLGLAREDYYLSGGEPEGKWLGEGAAELGLKGTVQREELERLMGGLAPDDGHPLVQLQNYKDGRARQPGWDLTFNAPKSVSILWAFSPEHIRRIIQAAHFEAVRDTLKFFEENIAFCRRGRGGAELEKAGCFFAVFEHGTSRAQDMHLHSHALLLNVARRTDGSHGTIRSLDFFDWQTTGGAYYRAALAEKLTRWLELELVKDGNNGRYFKVKDIPDSLCDHFSKRTADIKEALAEKGLSGIRASKLMTLTTRQVKEHVAREELFRVWGEVGKELGFDVSAVLGRKFSRERSEEKTQGELRRITGQAVNNITRNQAHFSERELLCRALEESQHLGVKPEKVCTAVKERLADPEKSIRVGERWTTPEMYRVEGSLLEVAERSKGSTNHIVKPEALEKALSSRKTIRGEQKEALEFLTSDPGSVKCVVGMAGTGKTFMLGAAREAWERSGYKVIGACLQGKMARQLQDETGIETSTIESFLWRQERASKTSVVLGPIARAVPMAIEEGRDVVSVWARETKRAVKEARSLLDKHTILVVDEAGMVDTRRMEKLLLEAEKAGSKVVLIGDPGQLQPIEAGGPYQALIEKLGSKRLVEITRQQEEWMRDAVKQFAAGDSRGALTQYALADRLHLHETKAEAMKDLVEHWDRERTLNLKETLIIVGTNKEAFDANCAAQRKRLEHGELKECGKEVVNGIERYHLGDRVMMTKNDRKLGVLNGDFGTVEEFVFQGVHKQPAMVVRLDRERTFKWRGQSFNDAVGQLLEPVNIRVTLDQENYEHFRLGYAVTAYKSQGGTYARTFNLAGGWMEDREMAYVQNSRAKELNRIFGTRAVVGEDVAELVREMNRSRQKDLAHDVEQKAQKHQREVARHEEVTQTRERSEGRACDREIAR